MSGHGVHAVQHEVDHRVEHGKAHDTSKETQNKRIALLISTIVLFLAISETLGKSAQTAGIGYNVEASNLWAFFQAKTIRITTLRTAADAARVDAGLATDPAAKAALEAQTKRWLDTAARYEDEADPPEGRKQLMARAKAAEVRRDDALAKYHHYEIASAAYQIGIVLASAAVITGMMVLVYAAIGIAAVGLVFTAIGLWAPHAVHLF